MIQFIYFYVLFIGVCYCESPEAPCGKPPTLLLDCLDIKPIFKDAYSRCTSQNSCEDVTCFYTEKGMMINGTLEQEKIIGVLKNYGNENPEWQRAMEHIITDCVQTKLTPEGIYLNCPAYDFTICAKRMLLKYAAESEWSPKSDCQEARAFAASCPYCPPECFTGQIPEGSCSVCKPVQH